MDIRDAEKLFLSCKFDDAFSAFEELASNGNSRALYFLGEFHIQPYGHVVKNKDKGSECRKKGYEKGDVLAGLNYAFTFPKGSFDRYKIFDEMFGKTKELAENGDVFAQNEVADCYLYGYGTAKNEEEGLKWLEKSAESGFWRSINKLANCYYNGSYVEKNYEKAIELYNKGAELGYSACIHNLGNCYYYGNGVEQSYDKAIEQYEKAYELGYADSAYNLAGMYKDGKGVEENKDQEIAWYTKGADLGDADCQFFLGRMYHFGTGVDIDYAKALKWYELAAAQNHPKALNNLGNLYNDGLGVKQNYNRAKELYYRAAENGSDAVDSNIRRLLLIKAENNSYTVSDSVKMKIQNIPNFRTDVYKIKSVSTVKSNYGINSEESIISYRVVPKLLAKLETGGAVFTDKCVYKRLPSGMMSSDYTTYGIAYDEMIRYLPALGYSEKEQPQLVGKHEGKGNLSFWMTPVLGTESNSEIVEVFWSIIADVSALDEAKKDIFRNTQKNLLYDCNYLYHRDGEFDYNDENLIKQLIQRKLISQDLEEDAFFLVFVNRFAKRDYSSAYSYVESNSNLMSTESFVERIDPVIMNKIETIGVPETDGGVSALKLYCDKNHKYIPYAFENIITYYFNTHNTDSVDEYLEKYQGSEAYDGMIVTWKDTVKRFLAWSLDYWKEHLDYGFGEKFALYAAKIPEYYEEAARGVVVHYCDNGEFDNALEVLDSIREIEDRPEFLDELKKYIDEFTVKYAALQAEKADEYIANNQSDEAIQCLRNSVKYDSENEQYLLKLISTELDFTRFNDAKDDIEKALPRISTFAETTINAFREMEIRCSEGIMSEMKAFYDLIKEKNAGSLTNDSSLHKRDMLGMNFYHYAILLKNEDVIGQIDNIGSSSASNKVHGYDLPCFACDTEETDLSFIALIREYDDDAKKLFKDYKKKKGWNTAKEIGAGILNSMFDQAISAASNADSKMRSMERDSRYASHYDEIAEKREQLRDAKQQYRDMKDQVSGYIPTDDPDELWNEYVEQLTDLAYEKREYYLSRLSEEFDESDFCAKLIYVIIKNPAWMDTIFSGDRSSFALHEESDGFWYLPEELQQEAANLTVQ